jgi:hypothetical protein
MTRTVGSKARRLLVASGVALVLGLPTLACMGGADTSTRGDDGTTTEEPKPEPKKGGELKDDLIATWKVQPSEQVLRELKIIKNAIEGKPPPKNLQPLSDGEKNLYQDAKKASGAEQEYFSGLINRLKGARVTFEAGGKGRYDFDGGQNPFTYTTSGESADALSVEIKYDHGMVEKANLKRAGKAIDVHFTAPGEADYQFKP